MNCPNCGSDALEFSDYDYGVDPETGYHDAGTVAICHDCGCRNDLQDCSISGPNPNRAGQDGRTAEEHKSPARLGLIGALLAFWVLSVAAWGDAPLGNCNACRGHARVTRQGSTITIHRGAHSGGNRVSTRTVVRRGNVYHIRRAK